MPTEGIGAMRHFSKFLKAYWSATVMIRIRGKEMGHAIFIYICYQIQSNSADMVLDQTLYGIQSSGILTKLINLARQLLQRIQIEYIS